MKLINFTAVEILPALLDKSKTQTIRKAWEEIDCAQFDADYCERGTFKELTDKPAKFKVGEKVKLMWAGDMTYLNDLVSCRNECIVGTLKKFVIGTVEITEVYQIEMMKSEGLAIIEKGRKSYYKLGIKIDEIISNIAKQDGFKSAEDMFKWFDKQYDLSQPRKFWCYRWRWI